MAFNNNLSNNAMNSLMGNMGGMGNVMGMLSGNPMAMLQGHPMFQQVMQMCNGKNPQEVAMQLAKQKGMDINQLVSQAQNMMGMFGKR